MENSNLTVSNINLTFGKDSPSLLEQLHEQLKLTGSETLMQQLLLQEDFLEELEEFQEDKDAIFRCYSYDYISDEAYRKANELLSRALLQYVFDAKGIDLVNYTRGESTPGAGT